MVNRVEVSTEDKVSWKIKGHVVTTSAEVAVSCLGCYLGNGA